MGTSLSARDLSLTRHARAAVLRSIDVLIPLVYVVARPQGERHLFAKPNVYETDLHEEEIRVLCPDLETLFRESATRLANAFTARIGASEERTFSLESFPFLLVVDEVFFGTEPNGNGNARAHHFAPPHRRPHRRAVRD